MAPLYLVISLFSAFTLQVCAHLSCPRTQITVLTSRHTSLESLKAFKELNGLCTCTLTQIQLPEELISIKVSDSEVLIDLLESPFLSSFLSEWPKNVLIDGSGHYRPERRQLYPSLEAELEALLDLATTLNITRFCMFLPASFHFSPQILNFYSQMQVTVELIGEGARVDLVIRKKVHTYGFTTFVVLLSSPETDRVLQELEAAEFEGKEIEVLTSSRSAECFLKSVAGDRRATGPLFLLPRGCEDADSPADLLLCQLSLALGDQLGVDFVVMNMVQATPTLIGSIHANTVLLTAPVTYHRRAPEVYQTLLYSFNNGIQASENTGKTRQFLYNGVDIAMESIHKDGQLLQYHFLRQVNLSLGYSDFDEAWVHKELTKYSREDLGIAMFTSVYSSMAMGVYEVLDSMRLGIPQIGASNTALALSSRTDYPLYTRVVMSDAYLSVLYGQMMKHFGWSKIGLVYTNRTWEIDVYRLLLRVTQSLNITIVNQENLRCIPKAPSDEQLNATMSALIASKVRIIILLIGETDLYRAITSLYDLGMRRGDVVFLAIEWLGPELFQQADAEIKRKIIDLCRGAIQFYPVAKIGNVGQTFAQRYLETYGQEAPFYSCFYYDAAYMLAHALDYMLVWGLDYSQPLALNNALRSTKFKGCSGMVSIDKDSNDRSPMMYGIMNAQVSADGDITIVTVGTFNPAGLVLFNFTREIIWPDGTTQVPTDLRISLIDCPFNEREIVNVRSAAILMSVAVCAAIAIAVIFVLLIWKTTWRNRAIMQTTRAEISFDDYLLFGAIAIEALQYSAMGPSKPAWGPIIYITKLCAIQLSDLTDLRNGVYWLALSIIFTVIIVWVFLIAILRFRVCKGISCVERRLESIAEVTLPLVGDLCFVPICSILLRVFHCTQAAGDEAISNTFLQEDCYQRCWEKQHIVFFTLSVVFFWVYVVLAVMLRPVWQDIKPCLHINAYPSYFTIKSTYQLLIIAVKTLAPSIPLIAHSMLIISLTALFLVKTVIKRPYGYHRANLWHSLSLIYVLLLEALVLLSSYVHGLTAAHWQGILVLSVGLLCILGLIVQWLWLPSLLYRRQGIHVVELFRFMFSRGKRLLYIFKSAQDEQTSRVKVPVCPTSTAG